MNFQNLFQDASKHFRYQKHLLEQIIFPDSEADYAFTLHAILKARFHYPNGISLKSLPCYAFLYIFDGTAALHLNDRTLPLTRDTTAWFNCTDGFEMNITKTNQDLDFILVFASGYSLANYYAAFTRDDSNTINSRNSPAIPVTFHQIYSNAISNPDETYIIFPKLLCDLMTSLVLDRLIQLRYGEEPDHIIKIINYIQKHYTERITLDSIASHFAVSKYSLSRDFTSYMNQSLIDYLIDYRIEESKKLLQFTERSISEIASAVGFSTMNNFIQQFKKRTDLTPTTYRRQNQIYSSKQRLSDRYEQI